MQAFSQLGKVFGWVSACAMVAGCGADAQQIVDSFRYDLNTQRVSVEAEFSAEVNIDVTLSAPIQDFGQIILTPSQNGQGFTLGAELDLATFTDGSIFDLEQTRRLPNGSMMPRFIQSDLARLGVQTGDDLGVGVYLGLEQGQRYFGVSVDLEFLAESFPAGLTISQTILDRDSQPIGVVTLYGPKKENGVVVKAGGLFLATNISDLRPSSGSSRLGLIDFGDELRVIRPITGATSSSSEGFDVEGPDAARYQDERELYELFRDFQRASRP